ncbi:MAG: DUF1659 domain-containing protein [Candidatus Caldatribacteriaceae bacterium]
MANPVIVTEKTNRLRMRVRSGLDPETGRAVTRTLTFGNIKVNAPHQDIYDVAVLLAGACQYPLVDFTLSEDKDLSE